MENNCDFNIRTGGWSMYNYYRDNAGLMPMQNPGMMPMSNVEHMPSANLMPIHNAGLMPSANVMPMYNPCNPMASMPTEDLEALFPQTYNIIQPVVENACDNWMSKHGEKCPSKKEYESLVSDIYGKVEANVEAAVKNSPNPEERQFFGGGRRLLRDFIGALLITNLIRRRRRPFYGFGSPYYGGFYGGYPFY
jgi:hypothetical protein